MEKDGRQPSRLHSVYGGPVPDERIYLPPGTPDIPLFRDLFARFQAAVEYMDREIERLLSVIEETGHAENSLIVFTTDHGIFNLRAKGTLYDQGMAITLLMRLPGKLKKQMTSDSLVQNIDLAPTLLEAAGVPVPDHLPGRSLWPLLTGGDYCPHEHLFTEWNFGGPADDYNPIRAIRTERWHYLRNFNPEMPCRLLPHEVPAGAGPEMLDITRGVPCMDKTRCQPPEELYDVANDPLELNNLAGKPEIVKVYCELGAKIDEWMRATDDFLLTGEKPVPPAPPGFGPLK